ncbi:MAG TPA: hypothetical protein VGL09_19165 [Methylomirabilota bacterium]
MRRVPYVVLAGYLALFALALPVFPYWGPVSTVDEQLQYYQAARNFDHYGFTTTALLPDLSTGSSPRQHPLLYNHQPPGPQLLLGVLMRAAGERYRLLRVALAVLFVAGMLAYFRFGVRLEARGFRGASLGVLFLTPSGVFHMIDHPAYAAVPLVAFVPLLALEEGRVRAWRIGLAALVVFLGANYLIYGPLIMILTFWTVGTLLGALDLRKRHLALLLACAALAAALHLLQTVIVLGPSAFAEELTLTLGNRMFGRPPRAELQAYYDRLGLLLYGDHVFSLRRFLRSVAASLWGGRYLPLALGFLVVVITALVAYRRRRRAGDATAVEDATERTAKLLVAVGIAILTPSVLFPAFATDYGLRGHELLLGVLALPTLAAIQAHAHRAPRRFGRLYLRALLAVTVFWVVGVQVYSSARLVWNVARWIRQPALETDVARMASTLAGRVVMTNVDPTVVGFFTREIAFGGCHDSALPPGGSPDPSRCLLRFIKGWPSTVTMPPTAYVWVGVGNTFCEGRRHCAAPRDLDGRFTPLLRGTELFVYDLTVPKAPVARVAPPPS